MTSLRLPQAFFEGKSYHDSRSLAELKFIMGKNQFSGHNFPISYTIPLSADLPSNEFDLLGCPTLSSFE